MSLNDGKACFNLFREIVANIRLSNANGAYLTGAEGI